MKLRSLTVLLGLLTPVLLAVILYGSSVRLPFFSDDIPTQRYLTQASFADIWLKVDMNGTYYRPFANLFYKYVPLDAPLWHSLMLWGHLINTALTGILARQMGLNRIGQGLAMALFAVFPFTAQTVLWVGAGFHLLLTLLVLLAVISSLSALAQGGRWAFSCAVVSGFLAPFAHESGVLTPVLVIIVVVARWGIRRPLHRWKTLALLLIPMVLGSGIYWVARSHAIQASLGLSFDIARFGFNLAFFAQGISLPTQFLAGFLSGDAVLRAVGATVLWVLIALLVVWRSPRPQRMPSLRLLGGMWAFALVALSPAYLLLHPDYVRYGERLMGVAVPMMSISLVWVLQRGRWLGRVIALCVVGASFAFSLEYVDLHQRHATAYNALFADLESVPDEARLLFVNLPSQIESLSYPLPMTRANAGLLTDWLELRDFLWLNLHGREFTHITYSYIPELYASIDSYRQRVYGYLNTPQELPTLIQNNDVVWRTHITDGQFTIDRIGERQSPTEVPVALFDNVISVTDVQARLVGNVVQVSFGWQKMTDEPTDYTPFVHILCGEEMIGQVDGDPLDNLYAFGLWQVGEHWRDYRTLVITPNPASSACLRIRFGLYNRVSQTRAPIVQNGQPITEEWLIVPVLPQ